MSATGSGSAVFVFGESLVDITHDASGGSSMRPGGSPLNVAVGLARLGLPTTLATQVGDDAAGAMVHDHLAASGVQVSALDPQRRTSAATARLDPAGQASYTFRMVWDPVGITVPERTARLHVGSISAVLDPGADAVHDCVEDAHARGIPVSLDPNVRPAVVPNVGMVRERIIDLAAKAAVVKLSDQDADLLFPGLRHGDGVDDLLATGGPRLVALTRGAEGATLVTVDCRVTVSAHPVTVVDTIGAGDSFMAALLAALTEAPAGDLDRDRLRLLGEVACRAAAITCSRPGADPPWRRELPDLAGTSSSSVTS